MLMLGLGFVVGISVSVAYAVVADDLVCDKCVDGSDLALNSVFSGKIKDKSVMGPDLAINSVSSNKIKDKSVKINDLAPNSVGTGKIKDHQVKKVDLDAGAGTHFYEATEAGAGNNSFLSVTAMCDPGDMVVGGGFNAGAGNAVPKASFPIANHDGWQITYSVSNQGVGYQAYAICQDFRPLH